MHIAFFAPAWPLASHPNGVVTYVHWMREELRRQGHQVSVLTGSLKTADEGAYEVSDSLGLRAARWLDGRRGRQEATAFDWGAVLADSFRRLQRRSPIDVVEMEESFGWCSSVQQRIPAPVVVKLHGPAFLSLVEEQLDSDHGLRKVEREGAALRAARFITSPSRATLDQTVRRYDLRPEVKLHVVNPLSLPASAPIWSLAACRRDTLLFVGRFDKRKGGDLVLQAFASLLRTKPWMRLIFVGPDAGISSDEGPAIHFADAVAGLFSSDAVARVDYRGVMTPADICGLRTQAFATIVASRWENHSYTALEAMLQGCPVISSDAGGQPEFIDDGKTGLLARAGDAEDLCAKIRTLIDAPELAATLGHEARRYVLRHHSPERVVEETLSVYRSAVALKSAGG